MYYIYIMTNKMNTTLYTGVTNDIYRRVQEHKDGINEGFTKRYRIHKLVHYEEYQYVEDAIAREKQIKGWKRVKKIHLIEENNPEWKDILFSE